MGASAKEFLNNTRERWKEQPKKKKIGIISIVAAVILIALGATIILNNIKSGYVTLYSGLDTAESSTVYSAIQELGVTPRLNERGEVTVPKEQYDMVLLQLAAQGYPESAMPYDVFFDHNSITATESDKKTTLLYQLQNRLQTTLESIHGVQNAKVTLNVPDDTDYVWQKATSENNATGSVLLTMKGNQQLDAEQVSAIKNLVAFATPKLTPENVKVVDAATGKELISDDIGSSSSLTADRTLEYEQQVQKMIEDNVIRLLTPRYGYDGVVAVAKVSLDFDKMMEERKEILKQEDGDDAITHFEEQYGVSGNITAGDIVGEENNTDMPQYVNTDPNTDGGMTDYRKSIDYDYGYIKTQIEKGQAELRDASISVMVDDAQLANNRADLMDQISKSTGIPVEQISIMQIDPNATVPEPEPEQQPPQTFFTRYRWFIIGGAALLGVLLIVLAVIILIRRRAKQKELEREAEMESMAQDMEAEIAQYKQQLEETARAKVETKDNVIADEVRNFAKENPEITANLLRSWLKEDEA